MIPKSVKLIDDGTLDTVLQIEDRFYRYNIDDTDEDLTYDQFLEWAMNEAREQYAEECYSNELKGKL